jgi:hypothetical protein
MFPPEYPWLKELVERQDALIRDMWALLLEVPIGMAEAGDIPQSMREVGL